LDPLIEVKPVEGQIDDLISQINERVEKKERVLVTTLTKKMAEHLSSFLSDVGIKVRYMHHDIDTIERMQLIRDLRLGEFDVLVGINLLREGLDLPEVSLVAILDADKEGFLRSHRSLTQTVGRAARNLNGTVIMYADKMTESMRLTIEETERRRTLQLAYNEEHGITPQAIVKARNRIIGVDKDDNTETTTTSRRSSATKQQAPTAIYDNEFSSEVNIAADPIIPYMNEAELGRTIERRRMEMVEAAKRMDFMEAARLRDEVIKLEQLQKERSS
jgi:excinuclease ABC subunit B